jgi:CheY-like chemotaxis protein
MSPTRVLVVDDDRIQQESLSEYLTLNDFDVTLADSAEQAFELLGQHSFDLIIMDILLPEMDGWQAIRHIRNHLKQTDIPILVLTAYAMKTHKEQSLQAGAKAYLAKPASLRTIVHTVRQLLTNCPDARVHDSVCQVRSPQNL